MKEENEIKEMFEFVRKEIEKSKKDKLTYHFHIGVLSSLAWILGWRLEKDMMIHGIKITKAGEILND